MTALLGSALLEPRLCPTLLLPLGVACQRRPVMEAMEVEPNENLESAIEGLAMGFT